MKKNDIELKVGQLYILSAPPASGKSTFLKLNNIPSQMIVSTDTLRNTFYTPSVDIDEHGEYSRPFFNDNNNIFSIARRIVRGRLEQGLTTFVDAVSASESDRQLWADIANDLGIQSTVLIFDSNPEECLLNDSKREQRVGKEVIDRFFLSFKKESSLPFELIDSNTKITFTLKHLEIPESKIYVVGDTHGLKDEFIDFAKNKLGFKFENEKFSHSQGYKMLFLGDFIDRGTQSVEMLKLVKKSVEDGHYAIIGNHEQKLINFYKEYKLTGGLSLKGKAITQTAAQLLRCSTQEQEELIGFLKKLPHFLLKDNFAFTHAGLRTFDPYNIPKSFCIYSDTHKKHTDEYDNDTSKSDLTYHNYFNEGVNKYYLVRGHNAINAQQSTVTVLEDKIAFGGGFNALDLRLALTKKIANPEEDLNQYIIKETVKFSFDKYIAEHLQLKNNMESLVKNKLGSIKLDDTGLLTVYKYSKSVFFNQSWNASQHLTKCRGLVLDFAGNIVVHPFDKIFNYLEPNEKGRLAGANITDDTPVKIVGKLNGFLGCISKHPFKKNNLLLSTTGTTEFFRQYPNNQNKEEYIVQTGEYQGYIRDLLKADKKSESKIHKFLQDNELTLMFEVIHPTEKLNHVIKYEDSEDGLYLIGVRGLNPKDKVWTEEKMDELAKELGLKRPQHKVVTFKEAKEIVNQSKDEGVMVREADGDQNYLVKFKTPYYLIIKFLGRMGETNINKMYLQTDVFKQGRNVEEEFFPLIDYLVKYIPRDDFKAMNEDQKKDLVYKIVNEIRDNPEKFVSNNIKQEVDKKNKKLEK